MHELHHHYYESIVLSLKELEWRTATKNWLRLGLHDTATTTHRPKRWPHGALLTGLKYTGRMLHKLAANGRRAQAA